jgi:uncharacterized protein
VQRLLPRGLTVQTYDGTAWVSLTPFVVRGFRPPGLPALPWLSSFPETNVRTYVVDESGRDGLWFLSLDVSRLVTVLGARLGLGLPYHWADMRVGSDERIAYRSRRWWSPAASHHIVVEPGRAFAAEELSERDHFLTGRWRAYSRHGGRLLAVPVQHQPWPLGEARIHRLDENLLAAAGLPPTSDEPITHFSPGVDVRFGPPQPVPLPTVPLGPGHGRGGPVHRR